MAPNKLPIEESTETVFLPVHGNNPISGEAAWGLAYRYNCSVVTQASEFSKLTYRKRNETGDYYSVDPDAAFSVDFLPLWGANNAQTLLAIGDPDSDKWTSSLYNNHTSTDVLGLEHEYLHEVLIWQQIVEDSGRNASNRKFPRASIDDYDITASNNATINYNTTIDYNLAVDFPVKGLKVPSLTYNDIDYPQLSHDATAVGIRCFSSSAVGTVSINPSTAAFTSSQRINPLELMGQFEKQGPTELGYGVVDVFVGYPREYFTENVFRSVGVVPLVQLGGEKGDAT